MEVFFSKLQNFLGSKGSTILLLLVIIIVIGFAGWSGYTYLQGRASTEESEQQASQYTANNRIISKIPYKTPFYSISYDKNGIDPVTIKIFTNSPYYRSQAIRYLQKYDQEVTINHPIIFVDYKSPLSEPRE